MIEGKRLALTLSLSALLSTSALAPRALAGTPEDEAKSRGLFDQAMALADDGKWQQACLLFQAAHDLHATGGTALRAADCYERIGNTDRAIEMYTYVVQHRATDKQPERVAIAEQRLAALNEMRQREASSHVRQRPEPPPKLPKPVRPPPLWPMFVTGGLAIAGIAAGGTLTVLANGKASDVARMQSGDSARCAMPAPGLAADCAALHDAATSKVRFSNIAASSFLAGGAFAVASAGLAIWALTGRRSPPVRAALAASPTHVGLTLQGSF